LVPSGTEYVGAEVAGCHLFAPAAVTGDSLDMSSARHPWRI
jgi:hypothetical protein